MVLNEVDDIVVKLPHMVELRHQHGVAPPQPLVVLRQSCHGGSGRNVTAVASVEGTTTAAGRWR